MWTEETLGSNVTHKKGLAFKSDWFQNSGIPVVKVTNFTDNSIDTTDLICVNDQIANEYKDYCLFPGDIVIQTVGSWPNNPESVVGKVVKVPNKLKYSLLNQNAVIIKPKAHIEGLFFYYLLKSNQFKGYIINTAQGAANQASITLDSIFRFPFYLPPLPIQRKIAAILSAYDEMIENNNRRIAILEKMAEEIYREWFVRLRFPGHEKVKVVKSVPEGWEVKKVGELFQIKRGKVISSESLMDGMFPVIGGGLSFTSYHNMANTVSPTITISSSGANAGYVNIYYENVWASDCSFIDTTVTKSIYYAYLLLKAKQNEITYLQKGSAQPHVYAKDVMDLGVLAPDAGLTNHFERVINPVFHEIRALRKSHDLLKSTRDLLLPRLISGKLDVENLDIAFPPGMDEERS